MLLEETCSHRDMKVPWNAFVVVNKGAKKVKAGRGLVVSLPDSTNPSAGVGRVWEQE